MSFLGVEVAILEGACAQFGATTYIDKIKAWLPPSWNLIEILC